MNKLSIIIAVYNVEDYLEKCLNSVIMEKNNNIEIIIVDDGSMDNSLQICKYYEKKDSRIKIVHQENGRLSKVRNIGFINSTGDYIWHIDGDDYLEKNYYKKIEPYLGKEDIICFNYYDVYDNYKVKNKFIEIDGLKEKYILNNCCVWNKIIKRELLEKDYFPEKCSYNDIFLIPTLVDKTNKIVFIDDCIYNYVCRSNSISNTRNVNIDDLLFCLSNNRKKLYKKYPSEVDCLYINNLIISFIIKKYIKRQKVNLKYINNVLKQIVPRYYNNKYWNNTLSRKIYIRFIYYNVFFIVKLMVITKIKIYNKKKIRI